MKIFDIAALCRKKISGGIDTDETDIRNGTLIQLIITGRSVVLPARYLKMGRRIHPSWLQDYRPYYDERAQESDEYTTFHGPEWLSFDDPIRDGLQYVGTPSCTQAFRRVKSLGDLSNLKKNHVMSPENWRNVFALWQNGLWRIYNKQHTRIQDVLVQAVFKNPYNIPTWNSEIDEFPVDEQSVAMIIDYVFNNYLIPTQKSPANTISNSQEDSRIQQQRR